MIKARSAANTGTGRGQWYLFSLSLQDSNNAVKGLLDVGIIFGRSLEELATEPARQRAAPCRGHLAFSAFEYLCRLAQGDLSEASYASNPDAPIRRTNEWDNMDGTIERDYGGTSIFSDDTVLDYLERASQYARLLASIKINGIILTNVNTNPGTLSEQNLVGLGKIADAMRPYGLQIGIALNFASPQTLGNLSTSDLLDERVINWWGEVTDKVYHRVPDFGGYLVKASSEGHEGQPGPLEYNRTLAEGDVWECDQAPWRRHSFPTFVYEKLNIGDWEADRAAEAYSFFQGLDGEFHDNTLL